MAKKKHNWDDVKVVNYKTREFAVGDLKDKGIRLKIILPDGIHWDLDMPDEMAHAIALCISTVLQGRPDQDKIRQQALELNSKAKLAHGIFDRRN